MFRASHRGPATRTAWRCPATLALLAALAATPAWAETWDGGGLNANWTNAANWSTNVAPASNTTNTLTFAGTANLSPIADTYSWTIGGLAFSSGASAFSLSGNPLYLGSSGVTNNAGNTETINNNIVINANQFWTNTFGTLTFGGNINTNTSSYQLNFTNAAPVNLNGILSGTGTLNLNATSPVTLGGASANTYTGTVNVSAGILTLAKATALAGGTLNIGDGVGGTWGDQVRLTAANALSSFVPVNIASSGLLDLGGNNTTVGQLNITGGAVTTGAGTIALGAQLSTFASSSTATISGNLNLNPAATFTIAQGTTSSGIDLDCSAVISGSALTKAGPGNLKLSGNNTITTGTTLNAGTLTIANNYALGNSTLYINGGTLATDSTYRAFVNNISLTNTPSIKPGSILAVTGTISGTGGFTLDGGYTLQINNSLADNSYAGTTTVNYGTLSLVATTGHFPMGSGDLVIGDGSGNLQTAIVRFGFATQLRDTQHVYIKSDGLLDFNGYAGRIGVLTLTGGMLTTSGATAVLTNDVISTASSQTAVITGALDLNFATRFTVAKGTTISGVDLDIQATLSNGSLRKEDTGTLRLSAANTYDVCTYLNNGTLIVANNLALGAGPVNFGGNATLLSEGGPHVIANTINVNDRYVTLGGNSDLILTGPVTGAIYGITKAGAGTLTFLGTTDITGLTVNAGAVVLTTSVAGSINNFATLTSSGSALGTTGVYNAATGVLNASGSIGTTSFTNNGTLNVTGPLSQVSGGTLTNAGTVNIPAGASLNVTTLNLNAGSVLVTGTLGLSGLNFNGGTITLNGGTLSSGPMTLAAGTTLQGGGTVTCNTITSSGVIFASNPLAPLSVTGLTSNPAAGELRAGDNATLILGTLANFGQLTLQGPNAVVTATALTNSGTLRGQGRLNGPLTNASGGILRAEGGQLTVAGSLTTAAGSSIVVANNATLFFSTGLGTNSGSLSLLGGTLDTNNTALTNAGTISGRGTLRAGALTNNATIQLSAGTSDIFAPITNSGTLQLSTGITNLYSPLTANAGSKTVISGGATANFYGTLSLNGSSLFQVSSGSTAVFFANVTATGSVFTGSGTKDFEGGTTGFMPITSATGATQVQQPAVLNATVVQDSSLMVAGQTNLQPGAHSLSIVNSLQFLGTGTLDMADNDLLLHSTSANRNADLAALVLAATAGYNHFTWTGPGLTSTVAAAHAAGPAWTALGIILNDKGDGTPVTTTFDGQPVGVDDILVKYTYYGDANLDGTVDAADYPFIDGAYTYDLTHPGAPKSGWLNGDFNFDGTIDAQDYFLLDHSYHLLNPGAIGTPSTVFTTPEPASLALLSLGALALLRRKRPF